jgi:hypothetical protein
MSYLSYFFAVDGLGFDLTLDFGIDFFLGLEWFSTFLFIGLKKL